MAKTILLLFNKEVASLPPFMTILDSLCENYSLKVISHEKEGGKQYLNRIYHGKNVEFLSKVVENNSASTFLSRLKRRVRKNLRVPSRWHKEASELLMNTPCSLLWVVHENAAIEFKKELKDRQYILNIFELHDITPRFLDELRPIAQRAQSVVVPEYNRACMLKFWLRLKEIPSVIPNKPFTHPREREIKNEWSPLFVGKKILLYQGYLNTNRSIDSICRAVIELPEWRIVLLGKGEKEYVNHLKESYPSVIHIEYIQPPHHLNITSWARIGVVKYDWFDLNHAYCAPNKTWEYAGFDIPMIGNELPGLHYSIGKYRAGVLADLDDVEAVKSAILEIDNNYEKYRSNARRFYNSFEISEELNKIALKF